MAVKPTKWRVVTARKRASNLSTDAVMTELGVSVLLCCIAHLPIFWEVTSFSGKRCGESREGALVTPSCTRPPFFGDLMLFISALIVSGFGYLTFLLHGQVYLRHAYLHAHDYGSVWITAERRLVLTWGGRQGGNSLIDKSLWDAVSERWPYFTVKSFEGWILWVNAIVT